MEEHFPSLSPQARRRLAERGIDPERSIQAFLDEVRVSPPAALLRMLSVAPVVSERAINNGAWSPEMARKLAA